MPPILGGRIQVTYVRRDGPASAPSTAVALPKQVASPATRTVAFVHRLLATRRVRHPKAAQTPLPDMAIVALLSGAVPTGRLTTAGAGLTAPPIPIPLATEVAVRLLQPPPSVS